MSDVRAAWGFAGGAVAASALMMVLPRTSAASLKSTDALAVSVGFLAVAGALVTSARSNSEQAPSASVPPPPPAWNLEDMVERAVERRRKKYISQVDRHERVQEKESIKKHVDVDHYEGFSMEEARQQCEESAAEADARTPPEVLADLQRGNTRFWMGHPSREVENAFHRRALIVKQFPKVAVLGCSDSRVPVELVFDQGLGGMFVIRVAGNLLDMTTKASLEFAVHHLKVKVVVVMGHEFCGAVKAAIAPISDQMRQDTPSLAQLVGSIKSGLDGNRLSMVYDQRARDREAVVVNAKRQIDMIRRDKEIMKIVAREELIVVGAFYEISSGIVDFFEEVAAPTTETAVSTRDRANSRSHIAQAVPSDEEPETY
uniref:carbonic anhydrase n=1 Tax=Noctiluca scintillans TaxID=2966 RepID=A0A7S0ZX82_NOCSC